MKLPLYGFIAPLLIAAALMLIYFIQKMKSRRVKTRYVLLQRISGCMGKISEHGEKAKLLRMYAYLLKHTKLKLQDVFKIKMILFLILFLILILVKMTNISLITGEITGKFDYRKDLIYQGIECLNEDIAFDKEMKYFRKAVEVINRNAIEDIDKGQVENIIKSMITENDSELMQPGDAMANKLYYRIYDYYKCRSWNAGAYLLIALLASFLTELVLLIYNFFAETESKKELRFLKKLIILNGSIKPVDFFKLLKILKEKSNYHKRVLAEIEEMNKKNSVDNREIYPSLIKNTKNIETKLFYEKLDQANNYDFDQAIMNIENEFQMDRRTQARKIKKQVELIHAVGITGFMALIFILILYLIIPWLEMYDMNQIF